jgi:hypothetical protein
LAADGINRITPTTPLGDRRVLLHRPFSLGDAINKRLAFGWVRTNITGGKRLEVTFANLILGQL